MKIIGIATAALGLSLIGTGCATKKFVRNTVAPVENRVGQVESKTGEHDKALAGHTGQIEELDRDLSRTRENVKDVDAKATAAQLEAQKAGTRAGEAQAAADNAKTLAERGLSRADELQRTMEAMNRYQALKTETILFPVNRWTLTKEAKAQLDEFAKTLEGLGRYVIEVQGFTDKTGDPSVNDPLSQKRAETVARYLTSSHKIPLRAVHMLGNGWTQPVGDDKTREGRKMNRRVELRVFVPESESSAKIASAPGSAQ